jgi:prevent-host-death family protein
MKTELVTTLKRRATDLIATLQADRVPVLVTEHGKPAAYLVDVDSYESMNRRIAVLEGIALGEEAVRAGQIISSAQAKKRLARWLK